MDNKLTILRTRIEAAKKNVLKLMAKENFEEGDEGWEGLNANLYSYDFVLQLIDELNR